MQEVRVWGEVGVCAVAVTVAVAVAMCSDDEEYGEGVCVGWVLVCVQ